MRLRRRSRSRRGVLQAAGATGIAALTTGVTGCTTPLGQAGSGERTIEDMAGRRVALPAAVSSVVGLGGGTLRYLSYMGLPDRLAGVEEIATDASMVRPYTIAHGTTFASLPSVGPSWGGDPELIAQADPDVIFFAGDPSQAATIQQKTATPTVVIAYGDMYTNRQQTYTAWQIIGTVTGRTDRATTLVDAHRSYIDDLEERTADVSSDVPTVYYGGKSYHGARGITGTKYPFPPFRFVNAANAARLDYETVTNLTVSREDLLRWDPEMLFVDRANLPLVREDVATHPEYRHLSAIQSGAVFGLHPMSAYQRNDATMLGAAYYIGTKVSPERFADVSFREKIDEIYEVFLGESVHQSMVEAYGPFGPVEVIPDDGDRQ